MCGCWYARVVRGGGIVRILGYFRAKKATDIKTATCGVFFYENFPDFGVRLGQLR